VVTLLKEQVFLEVVVLVIMVAAEVVFTLSHMAQVEVVRHIMVILKLLQVLPKKVEHQVLHITHLQNQVVKLIRLILVYHHVKAMVGQVVAL